MRTPIILSAILLSFAPALAEPIYVMRPSSVPSAAAVLPNNAFASSVTPTQPDPTQPGPMHPENPHSPPMPINSANDPNFLILQSEYWTSDFSNYRQDSVQFPTLPDLTATVDVSNGEAYVHNNPAQADHCTVRSRWGINVLWKSQYLQQGRATGFLPLKVGTYNMVFDCTGSELLDPATGQPKTDRPFRQYGSFQRVKIVAVP
jgi:hypothetical protein